MRKLGTQRHRNEATIAEFLEATEKRKVGEIGLQKPGALTLKYTG